MKTLQEIITNWESIPGAKENPETIQYFINQANAYNAGKFDNEYEMVMAQHDTEYLSQIKEVKCGYIVLQDNVIRCAPNCSSYVATYDGCEEWEMHSGINAMIMGY